MCYVSPVFYGPIYGRFMREKTHTIQTIKKGLKSAHGPRRRDLTHILCKVSCFFLSWNPLIFVGYGNDRFFPIRILIFRILRNNADVRQCFYFELGLPVLKLRISPFVVCQPVVSCRVKSFNYKDFAFQFSSDELQYIIIYFFNF